MHLLDFMRTALANTCKCFQSASQYLAIIVQNFNKFCWVLVNVVQRYNDKQNRLRIRFIVSII
jgi:hypothetical protein